MQKSLIKGAIWFSGTLIALSCTIEDWKAMMEAKKAYVWQYDNLKEWIESGQIDHKDLFLKEILKDNILTKSEYSRLSDYIERKQKEERGKRFFDWWNKK